VPPVSAAIVALRAFPEGPRVLIVHPGGPFWAKKDDGVWSLPKGLLDPGEDPLACALREWTEETSFAAPPGPHVPVGHVVTKSGKRIVAFAARADVDAATLRSNEIDIEWPPKSGKTLRIPECDRGLHATLAVARVKLLEAQIPLVERAFAPETLAALGLR
jgi:predicted NUDIX family NTP pyrophosphohydrolase